MHKPLFFLEKNDENNLTYRTKFALINILFLTSFLLYNIYVCSKYSIFNRKIENLIRVHFIPLEPEINSCVFNHIQYAIL